MNDRQYLENTSKLPKLWQDGKYNMLFSNLQREQYSPRDVSLAIGDMEPVSSFWTVVCSAFSQDAWFSTANMSPPVSENFISTNDKEDFYNCLKNNNEIST